MPTDDNLKLQLALELEQTLRVKKLNLDLMDALESSLLYVLQTRSEVPNWKRLQTLLSRVRQIYAEIYPSSPVMGHSSKSPRDGTEPGARHFTFHPLRS